MASVASSAVLIESRWPSADRQMETGGLRVANTVRLVGGADGATSAIEPAAWCVSLRTQRKVSADISSG